MKITYRECDACGERTEWHPGMPPRGWCELSIVGGKQFDICGACIALVLEAVEERIKP